MRFSHAVQENQALNWRSGKTAFTYIMLQMIPYYLLGVVIFLFILLMFQALRLTEFVLVHGVNLWILTKIVIFLSTSFLPVILPMSLLFTVLFVYNRLSSDSEILAFYSLGHNVFVLSAPALVLSVSVALISAATSFYLGPWGNREFEVIIEKLGASKAEAAIREGTFSEGFFDFVIYANKVDTKEGRLYNVFLYDEHDPTNPLTIIAKQGLIVREETDTEYRGILRLIDGNMHISRGQRYTKIDFQSYDKFLSNPISFRAREKSLNSMTLGEISELIEKNPNDKNLADGFRMEYHKRIAISVACLMFALVGVGMGMTIYHRKASNGLVVCIALIVIYWILYIVGEGLANSKVLPPGIAIWFANFVFAAFGTWKVKKLAHA